MWQMEYVLGNHVYLFNIVSVLYTRLLIVEHLNFWMPCIILYHNICFMFIIALFVQYGPWSNYDSWVRSKYGGVFIEKTSHTSMLSHKCVKKSLCHRKLEHCFNASITLLTLKCIGVNIILRTLTTTGL